MEGIRGWISIINPRQPFPSAEGRALVVYLGFLRERKNELFFLRHIYMTEFRSFAFTVRPKDGVKENDEIEINLIKYLAKHNGYLVAEMEEEARHLHGQIYFEKPKRKYDFNKVLIGYQEAELERQLNAAEIRVLKGGTRIAFNNDFYTEYTNKPDSYLLYDNMPKNPEEYYPSEEEQEKVKNRAHAVDKTFNRLREIYTEDPCPIPHIDNVRKWFYKQMYIKKTIAVIEDKKKFNQRVNSLFHYLHADLEKYNLY